MMPCIVPPLLVGLVWSHVVPFVESVIEKAHGEMTLDTVKAKLTEDRALLVLLLNGAEVKGFCIFQIEIFDSGKKVLVLGMAAGEMSFYTGEYDEFMIQLAKNLGCEEIRAIGARLGWEKALEKADTRWKKLSVTLIYDMEK